MSYKHKTKSELIELIGALYRENGRLVRQRDKLRTALRNWKAVGKITSYDSLDELMVSSIKGILRLVDKAQRTDEQ
jgi:hypothetical protein